MKIYLPVIIMSVLLIFCGDHKVLADSPPPNIVVIFIDDMGYGDIGPFGSQVNETPRLDRMAEEGLKLTSFYMAASVCTPSRAGLMTGSYPKRVGLARGSAHSVLFPGDEFGLNPDEITIAELLQKAGYTTGIFGKWHLGDQPPFLPTEHGFDEYFGIPYSNNMWPRDNRYPFPKLPILHNKEIVDVMVKNMDDQANLAHRFTERAVDFICANKDQPFFVYLPHAFIHFPQIARPEFMTDAETVTEAQVEEVDWSVGRIMQTLCDQGLEKNTLVLFTSDNGGARERSNNDPLRGGKYSVWEGGFRVPALAWWPGRIPAGSVSDELVTALDLLPTFANIADVELPEGREIDGKDISGLLKNPSETTSPHDRFFYYLEDALLAVRSGPWKLIQGDSTMLFNLKQDIGESDNIAEHHPEIVERMQGYITDFKRKIRENVRPPGVAEDPQTLLPRPGIEGKWGYIPTLSIENK